MTKSILAHQDHGGVAKIINLPDPVDPQDAANKRYVDAAVESIDWKDDARVGTITNINLASPGATIDGVTMVLSDRVLVKNQTVPAQNGIYIWNGAAAAMTRAPDANSAKELTNAVIVVLAGTNAGASYRQGGVITTLGTDPINWGSFVSASPAASTTTAGIAEIATQAEVDSGTDNVRIVTPETLNNWAGRVKRAFAVIGDGTATSYVINHNFNTRDVVVSVFRNSGNFDEVFVDVERTSANAVTVKFVSAPAVDAYKIVVIG